MSFRSTIVPLLLLGSLGACDRQDSANTQAEAAAPSAPAATPDRSHKGEAPLQASFTAPDGSKTTLAAFRGKPVLVNLWATWCAPCIKEMPTLDTLAGRMTVVAVSQDLDGAAKVAPFMAKAGLKHITPYLDPGTALSTAYQASLPTSILYDSAGREVWRMAGGLDWTSQTASDLLAEAK